jgi:hypothetical protein
MRTLGVHGANLPTKSERSVEPADFSKAALIGKFARKFGKAFLFRNTQEALQVLGPQDDPAAYGWDAINGFFANLRGNPGTLYVLPYKGTSAVQATKSLNDAQSPTPEATLTLSAAYQGENEFGVSGNRTGYTFLRGASFSSAVTTLPTGTGATARVMTLESVVGFKVGDVLHLYKTGYAEYHFLTAVDEAAKTVTWADADYGGTGTAADYTAACLAFKINIYRKDAKGVVSEVDRDVGKQWCTFNSADPDKYVENVLVASSWLKATKLAVSGGPTAAELFPADVATVAYLESGADGTAPASAADWNAIYALLDNLPVRQIANVETSVTEYQQALETYSANRATNDNPIVAYVGEFDLSTKSEAMAAGQGFQRSDEVDAVYPHNWIGVPDPFAASPSSPKRAVPNAGHIMGWWIAGIATFGIHAIPARKNFPLRGVSEVYGYTADADTDRTDLAEAGVNVIQNVPGKGILVRNLFTPSTDKAFRFANALMMRNFIKISGVDSLQDSENTPNDISGVREDRMAMLQFMNRLWSRGSTGNVKEGETFGRYELDDGTLSTKADAFEVIADSSNNSVATLQSGERNLDCWFMFPSPASSIRIGVGLIYRVQ